MDTEKAPPAEIEHTGNDTTLTEEQSLKADSSRDVALQLVDTLVAGDITPEEDRQALRRIDCILMPVMFISFALQYMDKACLTGAALFGILVDLKLYEM